VIDLIVSGGQTGADRGALDAAIKLGIPHGGYCPRGRRAEDGPIPALYRLTETDSERYDVRTEKNVLWGDATLLVTQGVPRGGSALTQRLCRRVGRPIVAVDLNRESVADGADRVRQFLADHEIQVLNVAGPRESRAPTIRAEVIGLLERVLCRGASAPKLSLK